MKKLLLATNNPGKIAEIGLILSGVQLELITPANLGVKLTVPEDGNSYYENALKKAKAFFDTTDMPTLADDSGLEVDALEGAPGIHSHRFSPDPHATDSDRCQYLLSQLRDHPRPWRASFHCEVVLYLEPNRIIRAHGACPGKIISAPRGTNGFGYDPIFELEGYSLTMAEISDQLKGKISHRARALQTAMTEIIQFSES
ncbi:MAG: RdgB/HAM1 family non-canonical purine NTP pyrophosphatase [Anaerolineaceae bacterium]